MIKSFANEQTKAVYFFLDGHMKGFPQDIQDRARSKMMVIDKAKTLRELRTPRGNRLEALRGNRKGQFSIRINRQWRVCFTWRDGDAYNVEITDYH